MKKLATILTAATLTIATAFSMVGCGENKASKKYDEYLSKVKAPIEAAETLKVATSPDFAPLEFYDLKKKGSDAIVGFDVLLANYIAKDLGMKLEIKPLSFDACMTAVSTGDVDIAMSGFSWTEERAKAYEISDGYEAGEAASDQILICKKGNETTFNSAESFSGKSVGAQTSSLQELLTNEQLVTKGANLSSFSNIDTAIEALKTNKVDAVAVENGNGTSILANNSDLAKCDFKFEVADKYKFNVILIKKGNTTLLDKVNASLAKGKALDIFSAWYSTCQEYSGVKGVLDELGYDSKGNKILAKNENGNSIIGYDDNNKAILSDDAYITATNGIKYEILGFDDDNNAYIGKDGEEFIYDYDAENNPIKTA